MKYLAQGIKYLPNNIKYFTLNLSGNILGNNIENLKQLR